MHDKAENTRNPRPAGEEKGALTDALIQTAQDLKEVGIGVAGAIAYDHLNKPKQPKDE